MSTLTVPSLPTRSFDSFIGLVGWMENVCFNNPTWFGEDKYCLYVGNDEAVISSARQYCLERGAEFYWTKVDDGWLVGVVNSQD